MAVSPIADRRRPDLKGIAVEHILSASATEPHRLMPFARVEGTRVTYPGGADQV